MRARLISTGFDFRPSTFVEHFRSNPVDIPIRPAPTWMASANGGNLMGFLDAFMAAFMVAFPARFNGGGRAVPAFASSPRGLTVLSLTHREDFA